MPSYRSIGILKSIYEDSSSEDEHRVCTKDHAEATENDCDDVVDDEAYASNMIKKYDKNTPSVCNDVTYNANFRPTHTAMCVVLEHVKTVVQEDDDNEVVTSTLCSNVLIETGNRLNVFLSRAKLESIKNMRLSDVTSYTVIGKKARLASTTPIDVLTGKTITSKYIYVLQLMYMNDRTRVLSFEKMKAMYTVLSWLRVFTFNDDVRALNVPASELHVRSKVVRNICFDFLQCVRQALYTLQISTGTIRKEQLFLSGDTYMDTLLYYTPLTDTRMHSGGFSKYPLIVYPVKPLTGKRKRGQVQKTSMI